MTAIALNTGVQFVIRDHEHRKWIFTVKAASETDGETIYTAFIDDVKNGRMRDSLYFWPVRGLVYHAKLNQLFVKRQEGK